MTRWAGWCMACLLLLAAMGLSWHALAKADFLYGVWYPVLSIEEHIAFYAPHNEHGREDFSLTTPAEHKRLFSALVTAIHGHTELLEALQYRDVSGNEMGRLLTADEIGHLRDVSVLVDWLAKATWATFALMLVLAVFLRWAGAGLPRPGAVVALLAFLGASVGIVLWLAGPITVFDQLHEWIFPPEYPWFFYYEESLMTTLMKAPDIFAPIVVTWTTISIGFYALLFIGFQRLLEKR